MLQDGERRHVSSMSALVYDVLIYFIDSHNICPLLHNHTDIGLDVLNGVIVFLQCIFVVGLRSLGTKMIDPYGDDLEDLSVINYVEGTLEICSTIMNMKQPEKKTL